MREGVNDLGVGLAPFLGIAVEGDETEAVVHVGHQPLDVAGVASDDAVHDGGTPFGAREGDADVGGLGGGGPCYVGRGGGAGVAPVGDAVVVVYVQLVEVGVGGAPVAVALVVVAHDHQVVAIGFETREVVVVVAPDIIGDGEGVYGVESRGVARVDEQAYHGAVGVVAFGPEGEMEAGIVLLLEVGENGGGALLLVTLQVETAGAFVTVAAAGIAEHGKSPFERLPAAIVFILETIAPVGLGSLHGGGEGAAHRIALAIVELVAVFCAGLQSGEGIGRGDV